MKLLGAALILCGAALQCHALLGARRQERAALRELSAALEGLERGIRVSLMPLPRLLGQRGAGKYADAFFADVLAQLENGTPLPDGWREAAARTPLGEREQALVLLQPGVPRPLVLSGVDLKGGGEGGAAHPLLHGGQPRAVPPDAGAVSDHVSGDLLPPVRAGGVGGRGGSGV